MNFKLSPKSEIVIGNWIRIPYWSCLWAIAWDLLFRSRVGSEFITEVSTKPSIALSALIATVVVGSILQVKFGALHITSWKNHPSHVIAIGFGCYLAVLANTSSWSYAKVTFGLSIVFFFLLGKWASYLFTPSTITLTKEASRVDSRVTFIKRVATTSSLEADTDRTSGRTPHHQASKSYGLERNGRFNDRELDIWLSTDRPITFENDGLFNIHIQILDHLEESIAQWRRSAENDGSRQVASQNGNHIGSDFSVLLLGEKGSGKSSLRHLLARRFTHVSSISFCTVEAGRHFGPHALLTGILDSILREIRNHGDILPLVGFPEQAWRELGGSGIGIASLLLSLFQVENTDARFSRLNQILLSLDRFVVVWIEDIERFGNTETWDYAFEDLLGRLRAMSHICLVVATTPSRASHLDSNKLVQFKESLPTIAKRPVFEIVEHFRNKNLNPSQFDPAAIITGKLGPLSSIGTYGDNQFLEFEIALISDFMVSSLCTALETPRRLKFVLRQHQSLWTRLRGNIDHDDLLVLVTLEYFQPRIFGLLASLRHEIILNLQHIELHLAWNSLDVAAKNPNDLDPTGETIEHLKSDLHDLDVSSSLPPPKFFTRLGQFIRDEADSTRNLLLSLGLLKGLFVQRPLGRGLFPNSNHFYMGLRPQALLTVGGVYFDRVVERHAGDLGDDWEVLREGTLLFSRLKSDIGDRYELLLEFQILADRIGSLSVFFERVQWIDALNLWRDGIHDLTEDEELNDFTSPLRLIQAVLAKRGDSDKFLEPGVDGGTPWFGSNFEQSGYSDGSVFDELAYHLIGLPAFLDNPQRTLWVVDAFRAIHVNQSGASGNYHLVELWTWKQLLQSYSEFRESNSRKDYGQILKKIIRMFSDIINSV